MYLENIKSNRKLKLLLSLISLILCISIINTTYAKYKSSATGIATMSIAKWKIKVNDIDITCSTEDDEDCTPTADIFQTMTPVFEENPNIKSGVIAPGSVGVFTIDIDPTDTDVTFDYEISIIEDDNSVVKNDLLITKATINNVEYTVVDNKITGTIYYDENTRNQITEIKVYVSWQDYEEEEMDNKEDTEASQIENSQAILNVHAKFTQNPNAKEEETE